MIIAEETGTRKKLSEAFQKQKNLALKLRTEPLAARRARLVAVRNWLIKNREKIHKAMYADFKKPATEVDGIELFHVLNEIKHATTHLKKWARPKKVDTPLPLIGSRSSIHYEPRGVCLIISPWNYPLSLCLGPLVSALAAGNCAVLKPSEMTPHVSGLIVEMCREIFRDGVVTAFEGGVEISQELMALPFDHIFFTGSPTIGKVVMKAAAENLTSVTLELGGKSPAIVAYDANLKDTAERIAVGKFVNNGQTCIAPDYLLVDERIVARLMQELILQIRNHFTENGESFQQSASYARIVNAKHFQRLNDLLHDALEKGATVEFGGKSEPDELFMHPTLLSNVSTSSRLWEEEIFGPILPVITYTRLDEVVSIINEKPKPLALYIFTASKKIQQQILSETSAGGVCINDAGIQFLHHNLPFGGVNNSGIGKSHGYYGFLAFSNEKPVLHQRSGRTSVKSFYPPYTSAKKKIMNWFLRFF